MKDNLGQWIFGNKRNKGENKKAENKFVCLEGRQAGQRGGGKFFPIVGKRPKIFSNHWKKRAGFSNHWKIFFQSLEKSVWAAGLPDCAPPGVGRGARSLKEGALRAARSFYRVPMQDGRRSGRDVRKIKPVRRFLRASVRGFLLTPSRRPGARRRTGRAGCRCGCSSGRPCRGRRGPPCRRRRARSRGWRGCRGCGPRCGCRG